MSSISPPPPPPPGWYPDPLVPSAVRYFDGQSWTGFAAPAPQPGLAGPLVHASYPSAPGALYPSAYPSAASALYPPAPIRHYPPPPVGYYPPTTGALYPPGPVGYYPPVPSALYPPGPVGYYPPVPGWAAPVFTWRGAKFGLPMFGPGALADNGRRLGSRLLDLLVFTPLAVLLFILAATIPRPYVGLSSGWYAGAEWLAIACIVLLLAVYDVVMTARYGRTLGKAWLHIRPVTIHGHPPRVVQLATRAFITYVCIVTFYPWVADALWALGSQENQCLHTKLTRIVVINDPLPDHRPRRDLRATPTAPKSHTYLGRH